PPRAVRARVLRGDSEFSRQRRPSGAALLPLFVSPISHPHVSTSPPALDLTRRDHPHISFTAGIHYCIGAPLARIELAATMTALLEKAPGLRLAAEPLRKPNFVIRGPEGLAVEVR